MIDIDVNTYFIFDMLYMLLQVFGYTAGMVICFIASYYFGAMARKYVNK